MFIYTARAISMIFTSLYLLISIVACSAEAPKAAPISIKQPSTAAEPVIINILQSMPEISYELQQLTDLYTKESGNTVVFHIQTVSGKEDYRAALHSKLLAGESIDLFHLTNHADVLRLEEMLTDLDSLDWAKDTLPMLTEPVTIAEKQLAIPYSVEGIGLIVNRKIWQAAGISLDSITNYGQFSDALVELQTQIDDGTLTDTYPDLTAVTNLAIGDRTYLSDRLSHLLLQGAFPSAKQAQTAAVLALTGSADLESFFKLLATASPQRGNWKEFASVSHTQVLDEMASGKIAAIIDSTEIYRTIYQQNPEMQGSLSLLPFYLENSEHGVVLTGTPAYWGIHQQSSEQVKQHAMQFLTWLYQSEEGNAALSESFSIVSPYANDQQALPIALHNQLIQAIQHDLASPQLAQEAPLTWNEQIFSTELQSYFLVREKKWQDVIAQCQSRWTEMRAHGSQN